MWPYIWFSLFFISACCNFASVRAWLKAEEAKLLALAEADAQKLRADAIAAVNKAKAAFARKKS